MDRESGLLAAPENPTELGDAIATLLVDDALRARLRVSAAERVRMTMGNGSAPSVYGGYASREVVKNMDDQQRTAIREYAAAKVDKDINERDIVKCGTTFKDREALAPR